MSTALPLPRLGVDLLADETQLRAGAVRCGVRGATINRASGARTSASTELAAATARASHPIGVPANQRIADRASTTSPAPTARNARAASGPGRKVAATRPRT